MNQLHKDLTNMRKLLAHPHNWAQGASAYTGAGDTVAPWDDLARCWCLTGAFHYLLHGESDADTRACEIRLTLGDIIGCVPGMDIAGWNDAEGRTHADVLVLLDLAIAKVAP